LRAIEWSLADAVKALFWGAVVVLAFVAGAEYPGNVAIYAGFTVVSSLFLYAGFRKNAIFFDTFIGVLLWLGFWLRF